MMKIFPYDLNMAGFKKLIFVGEKKGEHRFLKPSRLIILIFLGCASKSFQAPTLELKKQPPVRKIKMMSNFLKKLYDFNSFVSKLTFAESEKRVNTFVDAQAWANIIWHGHRYDCSAVRRSIPNFPGLEVCEITQDGNVLVFCGKRFEQDTRSRLRKWSRRRPKACNLLASHSKHNDESLVEPISSSCAHHKA